MSCFGQRARLDNNTVMVSDAAVGPRQNANRASCSPRFLHATELGGPHRLSIRAPVELPR